MASGTWQPLWAGVGGISSPQQGLRGRNLSWERPHSPGIPPHSAYPLISDEPPQREHGSLNSKVRAGGWSPSEWALQLCDPLPVAGCTGRGWGMISAQAFRSGVRDQRRGPAEHIEGGGLE